MWNRSRSTTASTASRLTSRLSSAFDRDHLGAGASAAAAGSAFSGLPRFNAAFTFLLRRLANDSPRSAVRGRQGADEREPPGNMRVKSPGRLRRLGPAAQAYARHERVRAEAAPRRPCKADSLIDRLDSVGESLLVARRGAEKLHPGDALIGRVLECQVERLRPRRIARECRVERHYEPV